MDAKQLFQEGQLSLMKDEYDKSIELFTKALDAGFDPVMGYISRGVAKVKKKDFVEAIGDFTRAAKAAPDNPRPYFYRGVMYMNLDDNEKAVEDFTRAIDLKPNHGQAFFARGTAYAQLGMDAEAVSDLKVAVVESETSIQGFIDTFGIQRTLLDKAMALFSMENRAPNVQVSDEEREKLRKLLEGLEAEG